MSTPVLATKLFAPPRRPQLVARPRLLEQLDTTLDASHRLTLVSAPAGFGKTTLIGDWLTHLDRRRPHPRVGWLSLDDGDDDLPASSPTWWLRCEVRAWTSTPGLSSRCTPPRRPTP